MNAPKCSPKRRTRRGLCARHEFLSRGRPSQHPAPELLQQHPCADQNRHRDHSGIWSNPNKGAHPNAYSGSTSRSAPFSRRSPLRRPYKAMDKGPMTFYVGIDPTADSLHVGHIIPVIVAKGCRRRATGPSSYAGAARPWSAIPAGKASFGKCLRRMKSQAISRRLRSS